MKVKLLFLCLILVSCNFQKDKKKSLSDSNHLPRTRCDEEITKAQRDFKNGVLVFCYNTGHFSGFGYRSEKEMTEILKNYGILFQDNFTTDIIQDLDDVEYCYCRFMREKIDKKYGSNFIDSIRGAADEQWLEKHADEIIHDYYCDFEALYPGDTDYRAGEYSETLSRELRDILIYPKEYIRSKELYERNYVNIYFDVFRTGNIKNMSYSFYFCCESNKQYERYFTKILERNIKKTGWTPAQIRGHPVNSNKVLRFYFE